MRFLLNIQRVDIFDSIGGWNSRFITWDEEMEGYVPWQTGFNNTSIGTGKREDAIAHAKLWAECEGVEYRGPNE